MLNIIIFAIGIMYTPGPVNLLSLNRGLRNAPAALVPFALGVACALCLWFLLVGYAGTAIVNEAALPYLGIPGCLFIFYLAYKVLTSPVDIPVATGSEAPAGREENGFSLTFRDGLLLQLLNPKAFLVVLPVATVQFPSAGITGASVAVWSVLLALLGFGAPMSYAAAGSLLGRRLDAPRVLRLFNLLMAALLVYVACDIAYQHAYLPFAG